MSSVAPVPPGFRTITPHLVVRNAAAAIDFYRKAFGAEEVMRLTGPDGNSVMHAELKIGDSLLMLADEFPDMNCHSPQKYGGTSVGIHLYVKDVDTAFSRAVGAGATPIMPPSDMFWGDRYGKLTDPFGHEWSLATHTRDVSPEECRNAMLTMCSH